jgi:hypothetical protein
MIKKQYGGLVIFFDVDAMVIINETLLLYVKFDAQVDHNIHSFIHEWPYSPFLGPAQDLYLHTDIRSSSGKPTHEPIV